jgi:hypothetical protein
MMCCARLVGRFPARDSRWRCWSPEDASSGAVPFQDANPSRSANRRCRRRRTAVWRLRRADAVQVHRRGSAGDDDLFEVLLRCLDRGVDGLELTVAWGEGRNCVAPSGKDSSSTRCSRLIVCVRARRARRGGRPGRPSAHRPGRSCGPLPAASPLPRGRPPAASLRTDARPASGPITYDPPRARRAGSTQRRPWRASFPQHLRGGGTSSRSRWRW